MNILDALKPLYKVDRLLSRTILASLSHKHIDNIIEWGQMPPEAVLAMVFYHVAVKNIAAVFIKVNICLFFCGTTTI